MAYSKTTWVNGKTALNDINMNKIERGIYDNSVSVEKLNERVEISTSLAIKTLSSNISSTSFNTANSNISCYKRNGVVIVSGKLVTKGTIKLTGSVDVLTLPDGYKPPIGIHIWASVRRDTTERFSAFIYINTDGLIKLQCPSSQIQSEDTIHFTATYPVL